MYFKNSINVMYRALVIAMMSLTLFTAAPVTQSYAQQGTPAIAQILCRANNFIAGPTGKGIAILVVISLAIGLFLGKVSWGMAIAVAVGMGILFGAPGIVNAISGGTALNCAAIT